MGPDASRAVAHSVEQRFGTAWNDHGIRYPVEDRLDPGEPPFAGAHVYNPVAETYVPQDAFERLFVRWLRAVAGETRPGGAIHPIDEMLCRAAPDTLGVVGGRDGMKAIVAGLLLLLLLPACGHHATPPPPRANGAACGATGDCASGFCVDGVCCDSACDPLPGTIAECTAESGGVCSSTCDVGFADCDGDSSNGCEAKLDSGTTTCGSCSTDCNAVVQNSTAGCVAGACTHGACTNGFGDCDGNPDNGCEQPLDSAAHCGACGTACSGGQSCVFQSCSAAGVYACVTPVQSGSCTSRSDDRDGDGLLDAWETAGFIDLNCNGKNDGDGIDVQLPDAHVDFPDVYLEIDYMQQAGSGAACSTDAECQAAVAGEQCIGGVCTHTHQPKLTALAAVQTAAQRGLPADVSRPGFYLHYDTAHSNAIAETPVVAFDTSNAACVGPSAVSFFALKDASYYSGPGGPSSAFAARRRLVYHYAVFAHYSSCPPDASGGNTFCDACATDRGFGSPKAGGTGTAETPGNDLIVSLGGLYFGYPTSVARPRSDTSEGGTLMHELGHNLALGHGVTQTGPLAPAANGPLYSPIYFSVMNYNYQTRGVLLASAPGGGTPASSKIDFSDLAGCADLNEAALDESVGAACAASTNYVVSYYADAGGAARFATAQTGAAIDWNGDGTIAVQPDNLNRVISADATEIFRSLNDWAYDASAGRFTTLQFDDSCYPWTLMDGVAPSPALFTNELSAPEINARSLDVAPTGASDLACVP